MLSTDTFSETFHRFFPKPSEQSTEKQEIYSDPFQTLISDIFFGTPYLIDKTFTAYTFGPGLFKAWSGTDNQRERFQFEVKQSIQILTAETLEQVFCDLFPKMGFSLSAPVEKIELEGQSFYSSDKGALLISFEHSLSEDMLNALIEQAPDMILCLN